MVIISLIYISIFLLSTLFYKKNLKYKQIYCFWGMFVLALAIITFNMKVPINWDLWSHYKLLNIIRSSELNLNQFLFGGVEVYNADGYRQMLFFNLYRYLIVYLFENNAWFPTITVIVVYSILGYIFIDYWKGNNCKKGTFIISIIISFAYMPLLYVASGIRNALATSIVGLGIYFYLYKKSNRIIFIFLFFIGATIHQGVIIVLPFVLLAKIRVGLKGIIFVIVISVMSQRIALLMTNSSIVYLRALGRAYYQYTGGSQYRGGRGNLYGILIITTILLIYMLKFRNKYIKKGLDKIYYINEFILLYMFYILSNIGNYDLVLRPAYVLGVLAPILSQQMFNIDMGIKNNINLGVRRGMNLIIITMSIYINYKCFEIFVEAFK